MPNINHALLIGASIEKEWVGTNISFKLLEGDKNKLLHSYPGMTGQIEQQIILNVNTIL